MVATILEVLVYKRQYLTLGRRVTVLALSLTLGRRVTVVVWSFVHSFILSPGTVFTSTPQRRHEQDRHVNISRFDSWILLKRWRSRVMSSLH